MIVTQSRVLTIFAVAIGIAIIIFSGEKPSLTTHQNSTSLQPDSNAYIKHAKIINYDSEGLPTTLLSPDSRLYPDGIIEISEPTIDFKSNEGEVIAARANRGILNTHEEKLELIDSVVISKKTSNNDDISFRSEHFVIDNKSRHISTDKAVTINYKGNKLESIGLDAWMDNKQLELKSNVRGRYVINQ